eukprot:5188712-Amphidinium_carterae.1
MPESVSEFDILLRLMRKSGVGGGLETKKLFLKSNHMFRIRKVGFASPRNIGQSLPELWSDFSTRGHATGVAA